MASMRRVVILLVVLAASGSLLAQPALNLGLLRNPVYQSSDNLRDPAVLKTAAGYLVFYSRLTTTNGSWGEPRNWRVSCAATRDFSRFEQERDLSPPGYASPGDVVWWHGRYILPYQSYPVPPTELCFSESPDLKSWSSPKPFLSAARQLPWNTLHRVIDPSLVVEGDTLHCFFVGSTQSTNAAGTVLKANLLGHALTRDPALENWEILSLSEPLLGASERVPDGVENVMVFRTTDRWTMIYSEGLANQHLALATSPDLRVWQFEGPILLPTQRWMQKKFGAPFVWREDHLWVMALMGEDALGRTTFGLLSSEDGRKWTPLLESASPAEARGLRRQRSLPAAAIENLGGYVGSRVQANTEAYLKPFDIERYTRMIEERTTRDWFWIGEQPGKWLESAVRASQCGRDTGLEHKARGILQRLVKAQEPGGYLGITDAAVRSDAQPLRGMDAYELYFTLHGLLTAAEEWKDPAALASARKLCGYLIDHIGPGKAEFWPSPIRPPENRQTIICPQFVWVPGGTPKAASLYTHSAIAGHTAHYSWEGTLLIDPLLRAYQLSGEARFLDWSRWVVSNIDRWGGWDAFSRLEQVAQGNLGIHQLQPYVHAHTFQMNFLGFLRLYEITGDASYLRKVRGAWDDIARRQLYITGGVSVSEHFEPDYHRPLTGPVVETCANMSWMELTQALLELTGEPRYADTIERLLFNHVFAAQTVDGDCFRYHTPPNGFKPDDYFHGPDCCTASGHRIVAELPRFIYTVGTNTIFVNQFVPSTARFPAGSGEVTLRLDTGYPETERILLRVVASAAQADFELCVRVPGWCSKPAIRLNGVELRPPVPGSYASLRRRWKAGDTLELQLPAHAQWVRHDHFTNGPAPWALVRGPLVYALDTVWWKDKRTPAPQDVGSEVRVAPEGSSLREVPGTSGALGPFYETQVACQNARRAQAVFVPFTNIGRWYRDGEPRPDRHSRAFSYAIWLREERSKP